MISYEIVIGNRIAKVEIDGKEHHVLVIVLAFETDHQEVPTLRLTDSLL